MDNGKEKNAEGLSENQPKNISPKNEADKSLQNISKDAVSENSVKTFKGNIHTENDFIAGNKIIYNGLPNEAIPFDLVQLRGKYLTHLTQTYRSMDFWGISQLSSQLGTVNLGLSLEDVYIPLFATSYLPATETFDRQQHRQQEILSVAPARTEQIDANYRTGQGKGTNIAVNIEETLGTDSKILILGLPGSGKSTVLKYITLKLASQKNAPLPILIPLNAYATKLGRDDCSLQSFFAQYYESSTGLVENLGPLFDDAIQQGRAIILLDGLDEISKERGTIVKKIEILANDIVPLKNKILLTSRTDSYRETPFLDNWALYTLLDFDRAAIEEFTLRWFLTVARATFGATSQAELWAKKEQEELLSEIDSMPVLVELANKPLFLTILTLIRHQNLKLPKNQIKLYDIYLKTLITTWNQYRTLNKKSLTIQDDDRYNSYEYQDVVRILGSLAIWLRKENPVSWLVKENKIISWLTNYYQRELGINVFDARRSAPKYFSQIKQYTNIFVEKGDGFVEFMHSTFGEVFAAFGLANISLNLNEGLEIVHQHLLDSAWQEIILLFVELLFVETYGSPDSENTVSGNIVIDEILGHSCEGSHTGRNIMFAGSCLQKIGEEKIGTSIAKRIRYSLLDLALNSSLPLAVRRDAGFTLGRTGWKPEDMDQFIFIQGGLLQKGTDQQVAIHNFGIGKYPVTNAQFKSFIEDDGYQNDEYWSTEGLNWFKKKNYDQNSTIIYKLLERSKSERSIPYFWHDPFWNNPLAPVVGISWFEAEAYCHWLSKRKKERFRLPTEFEWEYAASGPDNFKYPWGNDYVPFIANTAEAWWAEAESFNIKRWLHTDLRSRKNASTTIVGQFPESNTLSGISDLAGNVWEWTNSWFDGNHDYRVMRGGAWIGINSYGRCNYRGRNYPMNYANYIGFRVVQHLL